MKNIIIKAVLILPFLAYLTSCSNLPSASDAEASLQTQVSEMSENKFSLISFKKANAIEGSFFGQETYTLQYNAELEVLEDTWTHIDKSGIGRFFYDFKTYSENKQQSMLGFTVVIVKCSKGDKVKFNGTLKYVKTENGWIQVADGAMF